MPRVVPRDMPRATQLLLGLLRSMTLQYAPYPSPVHLTAVFTTGFDAEDERLFTVESMPSLPGRPYMLSVWDVYGPGDVSNGPLRTTTDPEVALRVMQAASRGYPIRIQTHRGPNTPRTTWFDTARQQRQRAANSRELAARVIGRAYKKSALRQAVRARRQHAARLRAGTLGHAPLAAS